EVDANLPNDLDSDLDNEPEIILPSDLDSLSFLLSGVLYTLPLHIPELIANGWRPSDTAPAPVSEENFATDYLEVGERSGWRFIYDDQIFEAGITNLSNEVRPTRESYITSIIVSAFVARDYVLNAELILPGNIVIGSTTADVWAAYDAPSGAPSIIGENAAIFYSSDYFFLQITINNETDKVIFIGFMYVGYEQ
ncbi:MAG: hypothetical protein FWC13_13470, partial [Oscillospiraceae bacterium]|nr:hypothetical protein [Oscillospiraceae bacterium]